MSDAYLGEIRMFGGNFAPSGWALCNGQLLAISQNTPLFSIIGTQYGGNGTTTFALPDLRSRAPLHQGTGLGLSTYVVGEITGAEHTVLQISNLPSHSHLVRCDSNPSLGTNPANNYPATTKTEGIQGTPIVGHYGSAKDKTMNSSMIAPNGGGAPVTIIQPFLCVTFIIALRGIFPSRN
jgi:microcystin-dependent protein